MRTVFSLRAKAGGSPAGEPDGLRRRIPSIFDKGTSCGDVNVPSFTPSHSTTYYLAYCDFVADCAPHQRTPCCARFCWARLYRSAPRLLSSSLPGHPQFPRRRVTLSNGRLPARASGTCRSERVPRTPLRGFTSLPASRPAAPNIGTTCRKQTMSESS